MKQALILLGVFVVALNWPRLSVLFAGEIEYDPDRSGPVILYATEWCGYCARTRAFLNKHEIPFDERDVEKSPDAAREMQLLNAYGVPVVVVGGTVIRGYQPAALARALDRTQ